MNTSEWLTNYYKLNNSFRKKLVFRMGGDAGFFSEYNNMVLAMIYCLKHGIRFELYSDFAPFGLRDGWNDFFVPFGNVNRHRINKDYNTRPYVLDHSNETRIRKLVKYRYIRAAYKFLFNIDYMTQDLWDYHRDRTFKEERFNFPMLNLHDAPLLEVTQKFIKAFWRYNDQSGPVVTSHIQSVGLPSDGFISLHVRAGDKFVEAKLFDFSEYMKSAMKLSHNRKAFILTDDYTVVEQLKAKYPDWKFYTLCAPTERGYFHHDFIKQDKEFKHQQHLKLFANMDICANSTTFIGTYSSNPGMFMGMRIGEERCHCLDFDRWLLW